MWIACVHEETGQILVNALSEIAAVESNANCAEVFVCVCVIFFMTIIRKIRQKLVTL